MIEDIPDDLLEFFHETNFVTRIEIETFVETDVVETMGGIRRSIERGRRHDFDFMALFHYDEFGQPFPRVAKLSAFITDWAIKRRSIPATVDGQPWVLQATTSVRGAPGPRQGSLTVNGVAHPGHMRVSDEARVRLVAMMPLKPVIIAPKNILARKQRGLEL